MIKLELILGESGDQELGWAEVRLKHIKTLKLNHLFS